MTCEICGKEGTKENFCPECKEKFFVETEDHSEEGD